MANHELTGAHLVVECLLKLGVERIFAIPGAKIDAVFDVLLDTKIKLVLCRHEQNAVFMAAIYGRLTGKPGVVMVTSGPGVSNLITGMLTATTEGDPVVAIGGAVPRDMKLKQSHQSADNVGLTKAATKGSFEVNMVQNIPEVMLNAFRIANEPRAGATFIAIPQDLLSMPAKTQTEYPPPIELGPAPAKGIEKAAQAIMKAKNPVLLLGLEASRSDVADAIRGLLRKTKIPTVCTFQGAGVISRDLLDCFVGRVGLFKNQPGDQLLDRSDLIVTIGFSAVEYDPEVWNSSGKKRIIHVDYLWADIHTSYVPQLEVLGDLATNVREIHHLLSPKARIEEDTKKLHVELRKTIEKGAMMGGSRIHPLRFISDLEKAIDDETTVISDIGTHYMWLARYLWSYNPHHLLFSNGQLTMGVALPWAIATKMVRPKQKVISISGDGSFLFSAMELETAVREKTAFVHCVWCDGSYDMVKQQQKMKYQRESCVSFGKIDHVKFAESFGAHGFRVHDPDELLPILQKAMKIEGPVIVEVPIDYSENPALFKTMQRQID